MQFFVQGPVKKKVSTHFFSNASFSGEPKRATRSPKKWIEAIIPASHSRWANPSPGNCMQYQRKGERAHSAIKTASSSFYTAGPPSQPIPARQSFGIPSRLGLFLLLLLLLLLLHRPNFPVKKRREKEEI